MPFVDDEAKTTRDKKAKQSDEPTPENIYEEGISLSEGDGHVGGGIRWEDMANLGSDKETTSKIAETCPTIAHYASKIPRHNAKSKRKLTRTDKAEAATTANKKPQVTAEPKPMQPPYGVQSNPDGTWFFYDSNGRRVTVNPEKMTHTQLRDFKKEIEARLAGAGIKPPTNASNQPPLAFVPKLETRPPTVRTQAVINPPQPTHPIPSMPQLVLADANPVGAIVISSSGSSCAIPLYSFQAMGAIREAIAAGRRPRVNPDDIPSWFTYLDGLLTYEQDTGMFIFHYDEVVYGIDPTHPAWTSHLHAVLMDLIIRNNPRLDEELRRRLLAGKFTATTVPKSK